MDNINLKLIQCENTINQMKNEVPVGTLFFFLKAKINDLEKQFYEAGQREYEQLQQETVKQNPDTVEQGQE